MKKHLSKLILRESATIKKAASVMDQSGMKVVLVCDSDNKLRGVLSYGDLRRSLLEGLTGDDKIKQIYNRNPVTAVDGDSNRKIKQLACSKRETTGGIIQIPILDKDRRPSDVAILNPDGNLAFISSEKDIKNRRVEKILVTGGAGYLGSVLVRRLIKNGYKVRVLDNLSFGKDSLTKIWANSNFDLVVGDILHIEDAVNAAKDVDAVVHLAATVGDEASREDPLRAIINNTTATVSLANICKKFQINRFIFASTCSVYGANPDSKLLKEDSLLSPVSLYAQSKIESELELLRLVGENFSPTILRFATLFGWSYRPRFDLVVNLFTLLASQKKPIKVMGGDQWRPFLHVKDAARAIELVLQSPSTKVGGEVFNVGSNRSNYRIKDVAKIIKEFLPATTVDEIQGKGDQRDYKVSFNKIKRELDYDTELTVQDGIFEMIKELRGSDIRSLKRFAFNSPGLMSSF